MKWWLCVMCAYGVMGCMSTQGEERVTQDEVIARADETFAHGTVDDKGVWHVDAGRLFEFELERENRGASAVIEHDHVLGIVQRESARASRVLRGVACTPGLHDVEFGEDVLRIEAHERDFSPGVKELTFGPLGQGEHLRFSARGVHRVFTDRTDIVALLADNTSSAFHVSAVREGVARVLVATSSDVKLLTVSVLPDDEVPSHARTVVELSVGESWEGISTMGVKDVMIGLSNKLSVENAGSGTKGVFVFKALEKGVTPVTFRSDVGESTTIWFSILGDGESTTIRTAKPGSKRAELEFEQKVASPAKTIEVDYVDAAQTGGGRKYDAEFTLMHGEAIDFDTGAISRIILERDMLVYDMCESNECVSIKGARSGTAAMTMITSTGTQKTVKVRILGAGELPEVVTEVRELRTGESVEIEAGQKAFFGRHDRDDVVGVTQTKEGGTFTVTAKRTGIVSVVIEDARGHRKETWIKVVD